MHKHRLQSLLGKLQYPGELEKKVVQNLAGKRGVLWEMYKWPIVRPFYRYGGNIELISFKEYYGMPRGHELDPIYSFGIYARFSVLNSKRIKKQLKVWTLRRNWYGLSLYFFSRKRRSLLHPNTIQSYFSPLKSYSFKTLRKNCPKRSLRYSVSISDGAHAP